MLCLSIFYSASRYLIGAKITPHVRHVFILLWLNLNPRDTNFCLHRSNLAFIVSLVLSPKTISSANNTHQGTSPYIWVISPRTITKRKGFLDQPWKRPIVILKYAFPYFVTIVSTSRYISCIRLKYFLGISFFVIVHQSSYIDTL